MKILHIITSLRTGGAEKLMLDLLPRLSERGYETELLLMDGIHTPFYAEARRLGIKLHHLEIGGSIYSPRKLWKTLPWLRRFDIVHTHNTPAQLFAAIGSLICPAVLCTTEHNTSNRRRGSKWYALADRWMYSRYRKVICISDKAETNLREHLGADSDKICTIYNGVDITKFSSASPSRILEETAPGSKKIIMVAAFRPQKDQPTLIKALQYLPTDYHLFLVGDGERRAELQALVNNQGLESRVHFMGLRSDIPELLHAADCVVMSSHYEGLSLSSVEGMAVGKPFLASDVDGLREVVKDAGILFPHGDSPALAREILRLSSDIDYYRNTAEACAARAARYDISRMAEGYASVYDSIK